MTQARIYLDNAATSWPKPDSVYQAIEQYTRECGAPAGRSAYRDANQAGRLVDQTRSAVAKFLGASEAKRIAFSLNGTDALNQAIHGIVRPGDHVVTTVTEHNSVLRPLRFLESNAEVEVTRVGCDEQGLVSADELLSAVRAETRLVILNHGSNVTGTLQPAQEVGQALKDRETLLLIDAAQTLGHMPVDVSGLGCDLLAAPGHKGLLGPLGTGLLYVGPKAEAQLRPTRQGGTGTRSDDDSQPENLPERLESGSLNLPGLAGLQTGVQYLTEQGMVKIRQHGEELTRILLEGLSQIHGVTLFGLPTAETRLPVVSFQIQGYDPQEVSAMLDASAGVQTRSGLHCAPLMHRALGTLEQGGAVRFSMGIFNTKAEIETAIEAVSALAATAM